MFSYQAPKAIPANSQHLSSKLYDWETSNWSSLKNKTSKGYSCTNAGEMLKKFK